MDQNVRSTGHGYGGSIREAGGSLGAMGAAREELYFKEQDEKNIKKLSENIKSKSTSSSEKNETTK